MHAHHRSLCCHPFCVPLLQIFYQVCAGVTSAERQAYRLEQANYYYYLSCSQCYEVPGINDVADWKEMNESFSVMGISEAERQEVIRAVSVCLWLGNLAFCEKKSEVAEVQDRQVLDIVAGLLQVQAQQLEHALCNRQIQTGVGARGQRGIVAGAALGAAAVCIVALMLLPLFLPGPCSCVMVAEKYVKPNTAVASDFCRDTLAKAIFTRMFDWLVYKINQAIKKDEFQGIQIGVLGTITQGTQAARAASCSCLSALSVLTRASISVYACRCYADIYGFEIFQYNRSVANNAAQ